MTNALLQSAKQHAYSLGRHLGEGPSLQNFIDRSALRKIVGPRVVTNICNNAVSGTPMHRQSSCLEGDRETIPRKRRPSNVVELDQDGSHRPEYAYINIDRRERARPKKLNFQYATVQAPHVSNHHVVVEWHVHPTVWALRKTDAGSRVKCMAWINGKGACGQSISHSGLATPAPCFYGARRHPNGMTPQYLWFCPNDCTQKWVPSKAIIQKPEMAPSKWPIAKGTNLSQMEIDSLTQAGFILETPTK